MGTDVMFDFSMPFEINDDVGILKRLGLGKIDKNELSNFIPHDLLQYCEDQHLLDSVLIRPQQQYPAPSPNPDNNNHLSSVAAAAAQAAQSSSSSSHYYQPHPPSDQQVQQRFSSPPQQHHMSASGSCVSSNDS